MVYPFNPSTSKAETGRSLWTLGQYDLQSELQDSRVCIEKPYLKTKQNNNSN